MKTKTIRKRHELFIHDSLLKYTLVAVLASLLVVAIVVIVALKLAGITP